MDAAEFGADGSTHAEHIQDWREAFSDWMKWERRKDCPMFTDAVDAYFDSVEAWHEKNGTLYEQVN